MKIMESDYPAKMHCVFQIPTKFYEILCSGLRGLSLNKKNPHDWRSGGQVIT